MAAKAKSPASSMAMIRRTAEADAQPSMLARLSASKAKKEQAQHLRSLRRLGSSRRPFRRKAKNPGVGGPVHGDLVPRAAGSVSAADWARLKLGMAPAFYGPAIDASMVRGARQMNRFFSVCVASARSLLAGSADHGLLAQDANPILALRGRWAGIATLTPASGPTEPYKCVATYFPSGDGSSVKQN